MSKVPPLANTVSINGRDYLAGSVPPLEIAKKIKSKSAWGGEVPDLSGASDSDATVQGTTLHGGETVPGIIGGNAAIPKEGDPDFEGEARPEALPTDGGAGHFPEPDPAQVAEPVNKPIEPTPVPAPAEDEAKADDTASAPAPAEDESGTEKPAAKKTATAAKRTTRAAQ